jgi:HlyD family secretion protein
MSLFSPNRLHTLLKTRSSGETQKKRYKTVRKFLLLLLAIIISGAFFAPLIRRSLPAFLEQGLARGSFVPTVPTVPIVGATGLLQTSVYNLSFYDLNGRISEIDVTLGQKVKAGQVLARLDTSTLLARVNGAQANVNAAQNTLIASQAHAALSLAWVHSLVARAEADLNGAQANLQATKNQAQANTNAAQTILNSDQKNLTAAQEDAHARIQAGQAQLNQTLAGCWAAFNAAQTAAGPVNNAPKLPAIAVNSITKTPMPAIPLGTPPKPSMPTIPVGTTPKTPIPVGTTPKTPIPVGTTPKTPTPTSNPVHNKNIKTPVQTLTLCENAAQAQFQLVKTQANTLVVAAQGQVQKDQAAVNAAYANAQVALTAAQGQVNSLKYQITAVANTPDRLFSVLEVAQSEASLTDAISQLHIAQLNLAHATIVAPHDGVVTAINGTIGSQPGTITDIANGATGAEGNGNVIQLVDLSQVNSILLNVKETDITKVKVGQNVQFTLNAYGTRQFTGVVSAISPNGVSVNSTFGIVFPVVVHINPASIKDAVLFPNMTANAIIKVS